MKRSKKIFLFIAAIFLLIMLLIALDFSRRTEFRTYQPDEQSAPSSEEVQNP